MTCPSSNDGCLCGRAKASALSFLPSHQRRIPEVAAITSKITRRRPANGRTSRSRLLYQHTHCNPDLHAAWGVLQGVAAVYCISTCIAALLDMPFLCCVDRAHDTISSQIDF